jgi:hypothetical protein
MGRDILKLGGIVDMTICARRAQGKLHDVATLASRVLVSYVLLTTTTTTSN